MLDVHLIVEQSPVLMVLVVVVQTLAFCSCLKCPKWQSVALQKYIYMAVHHQCFDDQFAPLSAVHQCLMSRGVWHL